MFRIITDSGSDYREERARELDIDIAHLKITFPDEVIIQHSEKDVAHFYEALKKSAELPTTSQPSPNDFFDLFMKYPEDQILVLALSSGLSGTVNSAELARRELSDPERVTVVDTRQGTLSQNVIVAEAVRMRDEGRSLEETAATARELSEKTTIIGLLDSLENLKKGGRIPPSLAALGKVLQMKPVVELKDGRIISAGKGRGHKAGFRLLEQRLETLGIDSRYKVFIGTTGSDRYLPEIEELVRSRYPEAEYEVARIGGIIGTHVGAECVGIGFVKKNP